MKKELAGPMAVILRHCSDLLVHTLWMMKHYGTEAEVLAHRRAVARVLAELGVELLYPIYREYPELEPPCPPSSEDEDNEEQSSEKAPQAESPSDLSDPSDRKS